MYLQYFGLAEHPFSITPDPAFVYLSQRHRDALAHLLYGVGQGGSGGFVQLTGEVGTGKTTLCRCLLEQVPAGTHIALILNPLLTPAELLHAVCDELGLDTQGLAHSNKAMVDRLNAFLLRTHQSGERVVLVIDEAQNLSPEALEQIRLLTNLETSKEKLLQIVLLGQPELRDLLTRRNLRQLAQRITARYHLTPLGPVDTAHYVRHRMQVAGADRDPFQRSALRALYQRSQGVPRLINIIADRALLAAYASERLEINARLVHAAADEVQLGEPAARRRYGPGWAAAAAGLLLAAASYWFLAPAPPPESAQPVAEVAEPAAVAAPPPADAAPSAPARLQPDWLAREHDAAWRGLGTLWEDPGGGGLIGAACSGVAGTGYGCLRDRGSWARIRQLGLPVVLLLRGAEERLLLLRGLNDERVLVGSPGNEQAVPRSQLEPLWLGTYFVAWPQAPTWPRQIGRDDSGPAVDTVLGLAAGVDPPYTGPGEFGVGFEDWLKAFQSSHGLQADGIVGPNTLLYLMRPSISSPTLLTHWEARG